MQHIWIDISENCCILGIRHAISSTAQGTVKVRKFKSVWNLNSTRIRFCNPVFVRLAGQRFACRGRGRPRRGSQPSALLKRLAPRPSLALRPSSGIDSALSGKEGVISRCCRADYKLLKDSLPAVSPEKTNTCKYRRWNWQFSQRPLRPSCEDVTIFLIW